MDQGSGMIDSVLQRAEKPGQPLLYEAAVLVMLRQMMEKVRDRELDEGEDGEVEVMKLAEVPDERWKELSRMGFSHVWLMGMWQRSPAAKMVATRHGGLGQSFAKALPGFGADDIQASPYAVASYVPDKQIVESMEELSEIRERLAGHDLKLILDFVPNHVGMDHPWVKEHPEWFIQVEEWVYKRDYDQAKGNPDMMGFFEITDNRGTKRYLAHGKDPYYPGWSDTAQLNYANGDLRQAMKQELVKIAGVCDGVRCDMAMLCNNEVFGRTWGEWLTATGQLLPQEEFWRGTIDEVKKIYPNFVFIGEVYWNKEVYMQDLGFDYTYDKTLRDKLIEGTANQIVDYIQRQPRHERWVRFVENHDEPRALEEMGRGRAMAAAALACLTPGMWLVYQGQMTGRRVKMPVQLARWPEEGQDPNLAKYYDRLHLLKRSKLVQEGEFGMGVAAETRGKSVVVQSWHKDGVRLYAVTNYSREDTEGVILVKSGVRLQGYDLITGREFGELVPDGERLFVKLEPWQVQVLVQIS